MMLKEALIKHCSPTLAGIKTGNLFSLKTNGTDLTPELSRLNKLLTDKGLRLIPLRRNGENALIYLYRPERLETDLNLPEAADILNEKGYPCGSPGRCVVTLIRHLLQIPSWSAPVFTSCLFPPRKAPEGRTRGLYILSGSGQRLLYRFPPET